MKESTIGMLFIAITLLLAGMLVYRTEASASTRDYSYEAYCDSIWESNPDYYLDVLMETDEYQNYIETNGKWWD